MEKSRKQQVLEFITNYTDTRHYAPSYREIGEAVGLKSTSSVYRYIKRLQEDGLLRITDEPKPRAISLTRTIKPSGADAMMRVRLGVAGGGSISFDCNLAQDEKKKPVVTFSGILDASQLTRSVGEVISCSIDEGV